MSRPKEFDRDTVLDKAMRFFRCRGYEAASVEELVQATGLSRSSLYDTFGDKRALYLAALERYIGAQGNAVREMVAAPGSPKAILRALFEATAREVEESPATGCFVVDATTELAPHDPDVARIVARNFAANVQAFSATVRAGQAAGEINPHRDPDAVGAFFVNALMGLRVTGKIGVDKHVLAAIVNTTLLVLD